MAYIHRRSFLERLGLGAGAGLLSPIVKTLVGEARGAAAAGTRKRFVLVTFSNGMHDGEFTPKDLPDNVRKPPAGTSSPVATTSYTLPLMVAPLEPWKSKLLMVDGLVNQQGNGGHLIGYAGFSCVPRLGSNEPGEPGGITFDQYLGDRIGRGTPFPVVNLGAWEKTDATLRNLLWAKGKGQPVPMQLSPALAFKTLFAAGKPAASGVVAPPPELLLDRQLLDFVADDVKRVQAQLAGREKQKLDEYLASVASAQSRIDAYEKLAKDLGKCGSNAPVDTSWDKERFSAHMDVAAAALVCGLTNVATVSFLGIGPGTGRLVKQFSGIEESLHTVGHGGAGSHTTMNKIINFYSGEVARLLRKLEAISEGGRSILDNSTVMLTSDNGEQHHSRAYRWPLVLVGGAGGALKADGRYIRWPTRAKTASRVAVSHPAGERSLGDLYSTLGHALGAPIDDFGKGGLEPVKGPLSELLA